MFTGSVCAEAREWFKSNSAAFAGRRVLCGCCGNFTIETVLSQVVDPPAAIVSNDVSLYSSALGAFYTSSDPLPLTIKQEEFDFLQGFLGSPLHTAATMVVMLGFAPFANRQTAYHRRHADMIIGNFDKYHAAAIGRLQKRKEFLRVSEYRAEDVKVFLQGRQPGELFLSFMPTYAGGYEKLYRFLDDVLEWTGRPTYDIMDAHGKARLLEAMREQGQYVYVDDMRRDDLDTVAVIQGGHNRPVFIHSDLQGVETQVYARAKQTAKRPAIPILGPDEKVQENTVTLVILDRQGFAWFRDQYLSSGITPAYPPWRFGVCLEGKLVGVVGWSRGNDGESYYLMCDVALRSSRYKRLSKLLCMVANTAEMKRVLRQQTGRLWSTFTTTAFTRRAVSMKYRGVLTLLGRNEKEGMLNYEGHFNWTLKKAVRKWQKLEGKAS